MSDEASGFDGLLCLCLEVIAKLVIQEIVSLREFMIKHA